MAALEEPLALRALVETDLPAYKALRDAMLLAHPDAFTSDAFTEARRSVESYRSRLGDQLLESGHFTLGAFLGWQLVGAISCEREARLKVRHIGHVSGVMVDAAARGRGIGRALVEACIARARQAKGLERLTLNVTVGNEAARALYVKAGFRPYGLLEQALKLGDLYYDKEMMSLVLKETPVQSSKAGVSP